MTDPKTLSTDIVIFSVERSDMSKQVNQAHTTQFEEGVLKDNYLYKKGIGVYKNSVEVSFLVSADVFDEHLSNVVKVYDQESILRVYKDKSAHLEYTNGKIESIGKLTPTTQKIAQTKDSYSVFDSKFYIVE